MKIFDFYNRFQFVVLDLSPIPSYLQLLLFPEGTRWTPDKHRICQEIAKKKGYPEYKHMLLPRTKGFALSMELMKGKSEQDSV